MTIKKIIKAGIHSSLSMSIIPLHISTNYQRWDYNIKIEINLKYLR